MWASLSLCPSYKWKRGTVINLEWETHIVDTLKVSRAFPAEATISLWLNWIEEKKRSLGCKSSDKLCDPQIFNVPFIVSGADPEVHSNALKGFQVSWVKAVKVLSKERTMERKRYWEDYDTMFCAKKLCKYSTEMKVIIHRCCYPSVIRSNGFQSCFDMISLSVISYCACVDWHWSWWT